MMEEVSIMVAYDAHIMDQMSEEEILACLVAESRPKSTVPSKKPKLRESWLQQLEQGVDSIDRWKRENCELQQASLRLEQENDSLAHRLVTSKISLRNALDQAEDRVDELTKDLLQTKHCQQAIEEDKRGKEEEAAMLKEVFRRELEKAEQAVKRSSGIITDYKQICSKLTSRLERQQAAHKDHLDALKSAVMACPHCRHVLELEERPSAGEEEESSPIVPTEGSGTTEPGQEEAIIGTREPEQRRKRREEEEQRRDREEESLSAQVGELERELAETKLQVVLAKCKIQELEHEKGLLASDLQTAKNSWFSKTFTSLRTASGGLHPTSIPKDIGPTAGLTLHINPLPDWKPRRLSWAHREGQGNL